MGVKEVTREEWSRVLIQLPSGQTMEKEIVDRCLSVTCNDESEDDDDDGDGEEVIPTAPIVTKKDARNALVMLQQFFESTECDGICFDRIRDLENMINEADSEKLVSDYAFLPLPLKLSGLTGCAQHIDVNARCHTGERRTAAAAQKAQRDTGLSGSTPILSAWFARSLLTSQIRIRVGEYDFSSVQEPLPFVERSVSRKVVHPKYNFFTYEYDLALVRLESPLQFQQHIAPVCLPASDDLLIGENATVTGWGRLSEGGTLPSVLQEVRRPLQLARRLVKPVNYKDKIDVKHVYTVVDFAIGSQFIRHSLDDSEPIADLQGNKAARGTLRRLSVGWVATAPHTGITAVAGELAYIVVACVQALAACRATAVRLSVMQPVNLSYTNSECCVFQVTVPIVSNDKCKNMFLRAGRHEYIPEIFLCAGYDTGGQDSCQVGCLVYISFTLSH
ncbi:hypothetical protein PR048_024946 [Dryococelus australis]|uniref:Peptidase S1 domain-containing protein n=1 Tax=Dryococelus australis TaxID=614101 RepID=A0ABQ9GPZ5_9NEOP|nr:hypothetical protein PR048_024946 [Dryococelus australis]